MGYAAVSSPEGSSPTLPGTDPDPVVLHPLELEERPIDAAPPLRVVVVGAGISGITAAVLLPLKVPGLDLVIYERGSDIGGVWHQHVYPGVRCDVPSHVYQSTFAPSLTWSEHYSQGAEIQAYWANVVAEHKAGKYIRTDHEVLSAAWSDEKAKWLVTVRSSEATLVDETDILIMATGIFSRPDLPVYPGQSEYHGQILHTGKWDPNFDATGKNIAVIGNGASGMQILPQLQKVAARIDHYARSPTWVAGSFGDDPADLLSDEIRATFKDPEAYVRYRKRMENRSYAGFGYSVKGGDKSNELRERITELMKARLGDRTDLLAAIIPDFSPSCRRLTPGPGYLEALREPHVEYINTGIEGFTKTGVRTLDGKERNVDAVVYCTGAEKSFAPPFPVKNGSVDLASAWSPGGSLGFPKTYLGIAAPDFPNLLFVNGPQAAAVTGTLPLSTENQITLVARVLRKVRSQSIRTMAPTWQATEDFQSYCEAYFPRTVQSDNCRSWFNGGVSGGRNLANWPGSGLHANLVRREPRWEDWQYTYRSSSGNRFAYFGNGWTQRDVLLNDEDPEGDSIDVTPYLNPALATKHLDLRGYHETWYDV